MSSREFYLILLFTLILEREMGLRREFYEDAKTLASQRKIRESHVFCVFIVLKDVLERDDLIVT